jgi:hypothetical protein
MIKRLPPAPPRVIPNAALILVTGSGSDLGQATQVQLQGAESTYTRK